MARARCLIAKYVSKQNIGNLGKEIVIAGCHGNNMTMNIEWRKVWDAHWDRTADLARKHKINFLAGDWNMSLTEVPRQLRSRGILCDCVAWYPWRHVNPGENVKAEMRQTTPLGFDSCAVFFGAARFK